MKTILLLFVFLAILIEMVFVYQDDYDDDDYDDDDYQQQWVPLRQRYGRGRSGSRGYGRRAERMPHLSYYNSIPPFKSKPNPDSRQCSGNPHCENRIKNFAALDEEDLAPEGAALPQPRSRAEEDAEKAKRYREYENAYATGDAKGREDLKKSGEPTKHGGYLLKLTLSDEM